jgi:hypothetical protein
MNPLTPSGCYSGRARTAGPTGRARMTPTVLVVTPEADRQKAGRFTARLESSGEDIVANTRQPLVDGARELLARGFDPSTPLTMRLEGKAYDSFRPMPIAEWAKWTYTEPDKRGLKSQRWTPFSGARDRQKSSSEPSDGTRGHPEVNSLLRAPDQPETILQRIA